MQYLLVPFCSIQMTLSLGQQVEIIKSEQFFQLIENGKDKHTIQVIDFWATWCAPCIREIA